MDGKYELMRSILAIFVLAAVLNSCTKCVECEIRLKQSQDVIGSVDEFCGTDKKVEEEENRLRAEYNCIQCSVNTGIGTANSGVVCGDKAFTDSVETAWEQGAQESGYFAICIVYRDTANVTCVLKQ
jgi:hypothetical protein